MSCLDTGVSFVRLTVFTLAVDEDWLRLGALAEAMVLPTGTLFWCSIDCRLVL